MTKKETKDVKELAIKIAVARNSPNLKTELFPSSLSTANYFFDALEARLIDEIGKEQAIKQSRELLIKVDNARSKTWEETAEHGDVWFFYRMLEVKLKSAVDEWFENLQTTKKAN